MTAQENKCVRCWSDLTTKSSLCEQCKVALNVIPGIGGTKNDTGKVPLSLVPYTAIEQEARVLAFGAAKYGKNNYKQGFEYSRLIDACLRHVYAFEQGEDLDLESGLSHLAHARCCLSMLMECIRIGTARDDRWKKQ